MCNVVFLFGPSCSGKSTLGKALQNNLGRDWTYLDRDDLIEENICSESMADRTLDDRIKFVKNKIIIDAQIPWREKQGGELYFRVLPPLEVLLKRDEERTEKLQRSEKRAYYAREFVVKTYGVLSDMSSERFTHSFDSSQQSVVDEVNTIKSIMNNYSL